MRCGKLICVLVLLLLVYCGRLSAKPVSAEKAQKAVKGWLKGDSRPFDATLGQEVGKAEVFTNYGGEPIYYIVYLQPSGFVIVPADDSVEPIIGFVSDGSYNSSLDNPLGALVNRDLNGRIAEVRKSEGLKAAGAMTSALESQAKWERLESQGGGIKLLGDPCVGLEVISDVRVSPLVKSKWGQTTCCNDVWACYNYYTPLSDPCDPFDNNIVSSPGTPFSYGDPNNYPCGCVATAMAQLMRFHEHPKAGIGKVQSLITVDSNVEGARTRGSDGSGGWYHWDMMDLEPNCETNEPHRQAIGALCYDAGVSVSMSYTPNASRANMFSAKTALLDTFDYNNAVFGANQTEDIGPGLLDMINPNLDYHHPVLLSIAGSNDIGDPETRGHAVVCDGYGYNANTLYHHLNMGWEGHDNAWYNLPKILDYNCVYACVYNVFKTGGDEIISGRVINTSGIPLVGATVTAVRTGGGSYQAATDDKGIYAIAHVPSNSNYIVTATKARYLSASVGENVGHSTDTNSISGNRGGVDFVLSLVPPRYVDEHRPGLGAQTGLNWRFAYRYLRDAIDDPNAHTIWVADGTYYPDSNSSVPNGSGDRNKSFILKSGVAIYGGFAGYGAPDPNARDITLYETILSGDLNENDVYVADPCNLLNDPCRLDNSYHVVNGSYSDATAILDGFTITAGNASGGSSDGFGGGMFNIDANCIVNNCTFVENSADGGGAMWNGGGNLIVSNCIFFRNAGNGAGGILNYNSSSPTLVNCRFVSNKSCHPEKLSGAVANMRQSSPLVMNCSFVNNSAINNGVGVSNLDDSSPTIINCTFKGNLSSAYVGGIFDVNNCHPIISNCILWDNSAPQIYDDSSSVATVNYSDVQGGWGGAGVGNINADPHFVDANGPDGIIGTLDDNLRLLSDSPCIDTGNNPSVPADIADLDNDADTTEQTPLDLDLRPRFADGNCDGNSVVDMGAYEFAYAYAGDFDSDCDVDFIDFAVLANSWLQNDPLRDITPAPAGDGIVDIKDLAVLCDNWLAGK